MIVSMSNYDVCMLTQRGRLSIPAALQVIRGAEVCVGTMVTTLEGESVEPHLKRARRYLPQALHSHSRGC